MFYRRKVILGLIELLGGEVEKLRFQKLLFLYAMKKQNPEYDLYPINLVAIPTLPKQI